MYIKKIKTIFLFLPCLLLRIILLAIGLVASIITFPLSFISEVPFVNKSITSIGALFFIITTIFIITMNTKPEIARTLKYPWELIKYIIMYAVSIFVSLVPQFAAILVEKLMLFTAMIFELMRKIPLIHRG